MSQRTAEKKPPAPSTDALAALLASHPEECAAVVAVLALDGEQVPVNIARKLAAYGKQMWVDAVEQVINACAHAGIVSIDTFGECCLAADSDRYAIARVGAAAWLRAREGAPATQEQRQRAVRARLHEIAAEEARAGRHFEWYLDGPISPHVYRMLLGSVRTHQGLDIEAEVAAVWGPAGAGAPKGEQE